MMTVFALILGVAMGIGIAFFVVGFMLNASNQMGDSKAKFHDFAPGSMRFLNQQNNVKKRGGFFS